MAHRAALLAAVVVLVAAVLGVASGRASAATSCGVVSAAGRSWMVVAGGVPCSTAKAVTRRFARRSASAPRGRTTVVASPLRGFTCVIAYRSRPGGSCATPGATKNIVWLATS